MQAGSTFSINAKTCTFFYNNQENGDTILGKGRKYVIPIYQRPYSWTNEQIHKFVGDIFNSYWDEDGNVFEEPMFIGTMQLSEKNEHKEHEIIDGQQRLTTFVLLITVLKQLFPSCTRLQEMTVDWLTTKVNSGKQQSYLNEAIETDLASNSNSPLNTYINNKHLIKNIIIGEINGKEGDFSAFDITGFVSYLVSKVYFVVIETKAGLTKTLQIFNAINTTGLDLNGADIFKLRMYEYLTVKKNKNETAFEDISRLYKKIDDNNANANYHVAGINYILNIYQYILIARYSLPVDLYHLSTDTFYERLFDTIFKVNQWEHFKKKVNEIVLSLEEIDEVIDVVFQWENSSYNSAEDACAVHFIWESRYSRYWILTFVFLFKFNKEDDCWDKLWNFLRQISKLFTIYSIRFQKIKSDIYYGFMHSLINVLVNGRYDELMDLLRDKIGKVEDHQGWYDVNWFLTENLTENAKRKNIICKLSAMLHEKYQTNDEKEIDIIRTKLFENEYDIEHIQSIHDNDGSKREDIWSAWGENINSLGNLIILERTLNRKISNKPYEVKVIEGYGKSTYEIVRKQPFMYQDWDLKGCLQRKETERQMIVDYLFK